VEYTAEVEVAKVPAEETEEVIPVIRRRRLNLDLDDDVLRRLEPARAPDRERYSRLSQLCPVTLPNTYGLPEEVHVGPGAIAELAGTIERLLSGRVVCVADAATWSAVEDLLPQGFPAEPKRNRILLDGCRADDETVERLCDTIRPATGDSAASDEDADAEDPNRVGGLVAIGSGTIDDIVKVAASRCDIPYVVVGTAASTNGYVSDCATIISRGLNTVVNARSPRAVVLDTSIVSAAPLALAQAGLAELIASPLSLADWWLGDRLQSNGYSSLPGELTEHAIGDAIERSSGLASGDVEAYTALCRALVLSGTSMVVAGRNAPASGSEHLLASLWQMRELGKTRKPTFPGAHIGVAACITSALYYRLLKLDKPSFRKPPRWLQVEPTVRAAHGAAAAAVIPHARRKYGGAVDRVLMLKERWRHLRKGIMALGMQRPEDIRRLLKSVGAPTKLSQIGVRRDEARHALGHARDIRNQLTILDVAFELNYLPGGIDEVLDEAGV